MLVDAALCAVSVYVAIYLRIGAVPAPGLNLWVLFLASIALALPIFRAFGLYRIILSEVGVHTLVAVGRACAVYGLIFAAIFTFTGFAGVPRTAGVIQPILLFIFVAGSRVTAHGWLNDADSGSRVGDRQRVLIYGGGSAGRQIAAALFANREMMVEGFLDDDPALHGALVNGVPIFNPAKVGRLAEQRGVTDVLLAIPSASQRRRNEIVEAMRAAKLHVRTLPGLMDIAHGRVAVSDIHELDVNDLLGRTPVEPVDELMARNIRGKTVLVTGAGGSIGSELCRQVMSVGPARLLLFELSEYALYALHAELTEAGGAMTEIIPLLGSVTHKARMREIMETWRPDTVLHAAAYKHVPLVEHNPVEGVWNNVFGTLTVARTAAEFGVPVVILVSTDKAVRPTNVMGASKRVAELALQALNDRYPTTRFSMVRFGNVLGSSGSVVPLFRRQIRDGGPITVTDLRITRYFMTIPEAAQLVIQAGAMAEGGEVYVLDMGEPVRIADLARTMVEVSGRTVRDQNNPDGDIEIVEVGLRPGEKLYEELLIGDDVSPTAHSRIRKANESYYPLDVLETLLSELSGHLRSADAPMLVATLRRLVPEFRPSTGVADWVYLEQQATRVEPVVERVAAAI
jgi:FlaA1/EpsC-like NDP-sugar epimerase